MKKVTKINFLKFLLFLLFHVLFQVKNAPDVEMLSCFSITEVEKKILCRGLADVF